MLDRTKVLKSSMESLQGCEKGFYNKEEEQPSSSCDNQDVYDDSFNSGDDQDRYDLILELLIDLQ